MMLQTDFFNVNPETVLGLLVGGMSVIILYLAIENRQLKKQLINLVSETITKLTEIKLTGSSQNEKLDKIEKLILWVRKYKPKEDHHDHDKEK